jgi:hypothetical protein
MENKINNHRINVHLTEVYKETCMDIVTDHVRHFILTYNGTAYSFAEED